MAYPAVIHGAEKDVYETGTQQLYPLGQKLITPGGAIFRYVEMGATLGVANKLYQAEAPTANWLSQALATTAMAAGDATITFTPGATAIAVDELAGGTVLVEETDDLGHVYRIKGNTASAGAAACILTLENGVTVKVAVAIAGGNVLTVLKNPWKDVIISPATAPTAIDVGVPSVVIEANAYGWAQTRGVASCLVNGTQAIGTLLVPSNAVAGALGRKSASGTATIANAATAATVTHAMGSTPTVDWISVVQAEDATNSIVAFWVDTITATQFNVNSPDPGASALDVGWIAVSPYAPVGQTVEVAPTGDFGHVFLTIE